MKTWQKVGIGVGAVVVLGAIVGISVNQANKGVVTVQTAKVGPQDSLISMVTASGEVKPTTYTNVTAQGFGRITSIVVKEGDHIKKGQVLLTQENIQANADVQAQAAAINSAESGVQAGEAATSRRSRTWYRRRPTWSTPSSSTSVARTFTRTD